jgi:hypothetical protein
MLSLGIIKSHKSVKELNARDCCWSIITSFLIRDEYKKNVVKSKILLFLILPHLCKPKLIGLFQCPLVVPEFFFCELMIRPSIIFLHSSRLRQQ